MVSYSKIYVRSFVKIGTDIQTISRFCLVNLIGCNTDITDGRDL
jgi:hypothetical protein